MSSITTELAAVLRTVRRPGDFFASGTVDSPPPRLDVDGVGTIAFPLLPIQAEQLIAVAERAPYGRGEETLVDTTVRRTWQIAPDRVRLGGKHWAGTLEAILARVADGLGTGDGIAAEFYKLLVYDQGSFFVSHRDTEKVPGMFATLVVALPSESTGGELVVRHKDREVRLDLRCEDLSEAAFAAFYADCVHEVLPITTGSRLVLVYSLVRRGKGPKLEPPSYESEQAHVAALLRAWGAGKRSQDDHTPEKVIYPLDHAYTPAELAFDTLKGADAAVARVLVAAASQAGCDLYTALVSIEESGTAEYVDNGGYRGRWREPDLAAGEVDNRYATLSEWRRPDGSRPTLAALPIEDEELSPPDAFDDMEPDDEDFTEATGNEGATFERTYSRAALVMWPSERTFAVLNQAGLAVTLPYLADLADLAERWATDGADRQAPLWDQAHELAGHMLSTWPSRHWYPRQNKAPSEIAQMLAVLTRLHDGAHVEAFLSGIVVHGFDKSDNDAVLGALGLLSPDRIAALTERIIAGAARLSLDACAALLARVVAILSPGRSAYSGAAAALIDALPGGDLPPKAESDDDEEEEEEEEDGWLENDWRPDSWPGGRTVQPQLIVDLFAGVVPVGDALAARAADHILNWRSTYSLDAILVPAFRKLIDMPEINGSAAVQQLHAICVEHLRTRIAKPLEAPKDWSRDGTIGCKCRNCAEVNRFLVHPMERTWILRAAEPDRRHVEDAIRHARCDLDVKTERRGRPYSLICTKNQAAYDRRVKQRREDLADLERLAG
ncbi:2OG-Fe(II) oxygenase [Vineibacter terrae]|uniref:2OG-Fe(II) oxygenase n=1 Tax=Vineibacter terrae TaxID=2586908 RepID=A0A5C8PCU4_9HYPH|nr:2OG-Fe(II) oxygenase [Vineibacter terrae]TXL71371.1 2OG-Fe(II) oxygenase [Vineibacter terrae]